MFSAGMFLGACSLRASGGKVVFVDVARKNGRGLRQGCPGTQTPALPGCRKGPARLRDGQLVENGTGRRRHERLRQQCEISDRLGQRVEDGRSEEHTSELQSLMRISYAVFCLNKQNTT